MKSVRASWYFLHYWLQFHCVSLFTFLTDLCNKNNYNLSLIYKVSAEASERHVSALWSPEQISTLLNSEYDNTTLTGCLTSLHLNYLSFQILRIFSDCLWCCRYFYYVWSSLSYFVSAVLGSVLEKRLPDEIKLIYNINDKKNITHSAKKLQTVQK